MCQATWPKHLSPEGWEIVMVSPEGNLWDWVKRDELPKTFDDLIPAHQADAVRMALLARLGGVWMDATIYLNTGLDWYISEMERGDKVYGSFHYMGQKTIENWFLVCSDEGKGIFRKWRDAAVALMELPDRSLEGILKHPMFASPCMRMNLPYFLAYQAYCYLLDSDAGFKAAHDTRMYSLDGYWYFYQPVIPLAWQSKLVKFDTARRKLYETSRFQIVGPVLLVLLLLTAAAVSALVLRRRRVVAPALPLSVAATAAAAGARTRPPPSGPRPRLAPRRPRPA